MTAQQTVEPAQQTVDDEPAVSNRWALVQAQRQRLLRLASRRTRCEQDAEDAVAEAMVRAMEHVEVDAQSLPAWLTTVTMRLCVDTTRDQAREQRRWLRAGVSLASSSCEQRVCDADEARWLAEKVSVLPSRQERALRLRADGMDVGEVADQLDVNYRTAESLLARARTRMRALLAATLAAVVGMMLPAWRWLVRLAHGGAGFVPAAVASGSAISVAGIAVITTVAVAGHPAHSTSAPPPIHAGQPVVARHIVDRPTVSSTTPPAASGPATSTTPASSSRRPPTTSAPRSTGGRHLPGIPLLSRLPLPVLPSPTVPGTTTLRPPSHPPARPAPPSPLLPPATTWSAPPSSASTPTP